MKRRRYLVCYDISDPDRLARMGRRIIAYGYRMQYSVYICDLDLMERVQLISMVRDTINQNEDSVAVIDLGDVSRTPERRIEWVGRAYPPPDVGATIW